MTTAISAPATSEQTSELPADELSIISGGIKRSIPNGGTDVIKAIGNTKWDDVELK